MAKDAIVSDELAQKFATEKDTPYLRFVRGEGLDIISAHYVQSLRTVELKPWARRGGNAVFINHEASRTSNDCYVLVIPPGKSLAPVFAKDGSVAHQYFWWYHDGNRALRVGDWKLVADPQKPWELYDLRTDRSESENLAGRYPDKVKDFAQVWTNRAEEFRALAAPR